VARIAGVDLPREKRVEIALHYIFGIGPTTSKHILAQTKVSPDTRVRNLSEDEVNRILDVDVHTYLPGDLLVKMDIASMTVSLEARSPFLDHHLMEFAASLPEGLKLRGMTTKYLLKRVLKRFVPEENLTRAKMGFGVPIGHWFRGAMQPFLRETLLSEKALARGLFNRDRVRQLIDQHVANRVNHEHRLWSLLMLPHHVCACSMKFTFGCRFKTRSNEDLRQEFLGKYVPRIWSLGFTIPDPALRFDFLQNLTAVDWPKRQVIEVVYHLFSYPPRHEICVRVEAPRDVGRRGRGLFRIAENGGVEHAENGGLLDDLAVIAAVDAGQHVADDAGLFDQIVQGDAGQVRDAEAGGHAQREAGVGDPAHRPHRKGNPHLAA